MEGASCSPIALPLSCISSRPSCLFSVSQEYGIYGWIVQASLPYNLLEAWQVIRARMVGWRISCSLAIILPLPAGQGSGRGCSPIMLSEAPLSLDPGETWLNTVFIPCPFRSETGRASNWLLISVKSLSVALMLFPWCYTHPINSPTSGFWAVSPSASEFSAFWQNPDQPTTLGVWWAGWERSDTETMEKTEAHAQDCMSVLNQAAWKPSYSSE